MWLHVQHLFYKVHRANSLLLSFHLRRQGNVMPQKMSASLSMISYLMLHDSQFNFISQ